MSVKYSYTTIKEWKSREKAKSTGNNFLVSKGLRPKISAKTGISKKNTWKKTHATLSLAGFIDELKSISMNNEAVLEDLVDDIVTNIYYDIIDLSPVDSGAYISSHYISNKGFRTHGNFQRGWIRASRLKDSDQQENMRQQNRQAGTQIAWARIEKWRNSWKCGMGDVLIFNNVPYAGILEAGLRNERTITYKKASLSIPGLMEFAKRLITGSV